MKFKVFLFSLITFTILMLGNVFLPSITFVSAQQTDNSYVINNYDITIDVKRDNSFIITEQLEVSFGEEEEYGVSHGIYRYIPYNLVVTKEVDNKVRDYRYGVEINILEAKIIENSKPARDIYKQDKNYVIELADSFKVNELTRNYLIKYEYKIGYDRIDDSDEFYFNLIGNFWTTKIENVSFQINMPKTFTTEPNFYSGKYLSTEAADVNYIVTGNTISGNTNERLLANEGLTIRLMLNEGYFDQIVKFNNIYDYLIIGGCVLVVLLCLIIYITKRNRKPIVQTVEFYPPDDIDPIKLSYTLKGYVSPKELSSLIIYFASQGYLKIIDNDGQISLKKLKDIPSTVTEYEKIVFNALFNSKLELIDDSDENGIDFILKKAGKIINSEFTEDKAVKKDTKVQPDVEVDLNSLSKTAGSEIFSASKIIKTECGARLEGKSILLSFVMALLGVLPLVAFALLYVFRINITEDLISLVFISITFLILYVYSFLGLTNIIFIKPTTKKIVLGILILLTGLFVILVILPFGDNSIDRFYLRFITPISLLATVILSVKFISLNDEYRSLFGRSLGFRKHLVLTEKNRMKVLLKDDPSYFYNILPYAYVLGITNEYVKKFEGIVVEAPEWLESKSVGVFDIIIFHSLLNSSLRSFAQNITINNAAGSFGKGLDGGGFGGGFSGGGFGGGGGGRL